MKYRRDESERARRDARISQLHEEGLGTDSIASRMGCTKRYVNIRLAAAGKRGNGNSDGFSFVGTSRRRRG